jgi:hypothetical protein
MNYKTKLYAAEIAAALAISIVAAAALALQPSVTVVEPTSGVASTLISK